MPATSTETGASCHPTETRCSASRLKSAVISVIASPHPPDTHGWAGTDAWVAYWSAQCEQALLDKPDLLLLPEACNMADREIPDRSRGEQYAQSSRCLYEHFSQVARQQRCMIALPTMTGDAVGKLSNVIALIGGDGQLIGMYDKNYPTVGEMDHGVLPGRQPLAVDTTLGRVGFAICFDLNFAELRQAYVQAKVGLLLFASMFHGGHAQTTWAREMGAYFVSAVAGLPSGIIDPLGRVVCTSTNYTPHATAAVDLDYCLAHLDGNRPGLDRLKRDLGQAVRISDPGLSGIVMISSHAPDRTASQLAAAFDITPLRDYLAQSRAARDRYLD